MVKSISSEKATIFFEKSPNCFDVTKSCQKNWETFNIFWSSKNILTLRSMIQLVHH